MKRYFSNNTQCWAVGHRTRTDHCRSTVGNSLATTFFASPSSRLSFCLVHASLIRDRTLTKRPVLCISKLCPGPVTMMVNHTRDGSRNIESQTTNCSSESHYPPRLRRPNLRLKLCAPSSVSQPDDLAFEPRNGLISLNTLPTNYAPISTSCTTDTSAILSNQNPSPLVTIRIPKPVNANANSPKSRPFLARYTRLRIPSRI